MKSKTILAMTLALCSASVYANSALQIKTLQAMYQESIKNSHKLHYSENDLLKKYATSDLKALFNQDEKASEGAVGCIDYVVMWQGQDFEHKVKLNFTPISNNRIKVNIGKGSWSKARSVTYQMACTGNSCKISDVIEQNVSLKKSLSSCLKGY